jgi:hypothetical protein
MQPQSVLSAESGRDVTQAAMRGIFQTLTTAYTYSLDMDAFEDPVNHLQILSMLRALKDNTRDLEDHGGGLDPSFDYLKRSLAKDADEAVQRFEQGHYLGSRFMLFKLMENCMTCHSKLPREDTFDLGRQFLDDAHVKQLPAVERVNIEIAARQFDTALGTYEEIFASAGMTPLRLAAIGAFENYLKLCIGVVNDIKRPILTFNTFKKRSDMPDNMKELVSGWIQSLKHLQPDDARGKELATARELIRDAKVQRRFPADRSGLVDFVAAASLLHRYLQTEPANKAEIGEAYYLLGVAESYISRSYWISETDFLLEQAIRTAPKTPYAKKAFAFLEEYTVAGHAGVSGLDVSPEVRANLDELRRLVED